VKIFGRCHCGNISFTLALDAAPTEIPARACTCTFCVKHGGVWASFPDGLLRIVLARPDRVSNYSFGTKTAEFHVCADCGAVPVVTSSIEERVYAVVNVNTFEGVDPALLKPGSATFDGESETDRLARRVSRWIRNVEFA
jgi:hypothetical protein